MKKIFSDPVYLLALVTGLIILFFFNQFIFHANDYLLTEGGDGIKNYYTPAWYVAHDHGIHFTGMNYPYGEHVVFTDDQPVISGILNFIDDHLFKIADHIIGILNCLIFISLFISVLLIFKILRYYHLPNTFAFVAALLIGFGAPQLERLSGHFALAYTVYFPLIWYLFLKLQDSNYKVVRLLILAGVIIFFNFIHIYYLFIALLFFTSFLLIRLFSKSKAKKELRSLFILILLPAVVGIGLMKLTDHVSDRTTSPYGFFDYKSTFQSVFINQNGSVFSWMVNTLGTRIPDSEGYAYVGIVGLILLIVSIVLLIKRWIFKKKFKKILFHLPGNLSAFLIASILVLLFSMAIPFSWGLQSLLDIIPFIKQFRSPGRLAWVFYYVYTTYCAIIVYLFYQLVRRKNRIAAVMVIATALFLQVRETYLYVNNRALSAKNDSTENPFKPENNFYARQLNSAGVNPENYQAILFFPSFFQGSEKLYIDRTNGDYREALKVSYQTGLPLIDQMMSRTSIAQSLELASLAGHPVIDKKLPVAFNSKPLLLISTGKDLVKGEHYLIDHAKEIAVAGQLHFYELQLNVFEDEPKIFTDYFATEKDSLHHYENYLSLDSNLIFYRNSFEEYKSPAPFLGNGSYYFDHAKRTLIAEIPVQTDHSIWVELSYWAKAYPTTTGFPTVKMDLLGSHDELRNEFSVSAKLSTDIIGSWCRGADNFEIVPEVKKIRIFIAEASQINIDELVLRHTAFDMFYDVEGDSGFIYNNYPVGMKALQAGQEEK